MKKIAFPLLLIATLSVHAQTHSTLPKDRWVDSVFNTLTDSMKIAQLMTIRLSSIDPSGIKFYNEQVEKDIRRFDVGGIVLFQGGPKTQAAFINYFQQIAKTPVLFSIDGENGLGMRMDSVEPLSRQMMLGAVQDPQLIYQYGQLVGRQCKRMGIQINYAPVVDVNNNPDNPVINDRSFGENQYRVAEYGIQYMKGMQSQGVMAVAKHFPGHGDVAVDSHLDLPVINKSMHQLDTLELYPFKKLIDSGVGGVMIGHLYVPAIDKKPNTPTSISNNAVTKLLKKKLKFSGLSFTDALEMKGISKFYPDGEASVQSLIAGNDVLCLPGDVQNSIASILKAIKQKKLKWKDLNGRVKKVLAAKYQLGLNQWQPVDTVHLIEDLNQDVHEMNLKVAEQSLTLLRSNDRALPHSLTGKKIAYIGFGLLDDNEFAHRLREDFHANVYYFDYALDSLKAAAAFELLRNRYDVLIVGLHNINRYPAHDFGISAASLNLLQRLQQQPNAICFVFGNPYALKYVCNARNLLEAYDDQTTTQSVAADWLNGKFLTKGKLPVSVCAELKSGYGISFTRGFLPEAAPASVGFDPTKLLVIDSICKKAIELQATPGCVVLVAKNGKVAYEKAFGYMEYNKKEPVYPGTLYDLASVTKVCATTISVMKLYDEGKLDLHKTLGDYLPWVRGSDKDTLKIWDILLHQAGLKAFIPFYAETIEKDKGGMPMPSIYSSMGDGLHCVRVAEHLYMRGDWIDTMYSRILTSPLGKSGVYIYSDNDFIFMGKIVEAISGKTLDQYAYDNFYAPMGLETTGFHPRNRFSLNMIAPTQLEIPFRRQLIRGDVHDPGAAMFGGVSGHAGLFSDAYDLAVIMQMLMNGGVMNGKRYLKKETIDYFSDYHSDISRRALGFDKPMKDNATNGDPYPCISASPASYGHSGFTGIWVWNDPVKQLVFIFLSNRVNPSESNQISKLNVRGNVLEAVYKAMAK
ncbi:MAG TPA: glycoside hydrolase family 3 N-terminal domain-containing protein [Puia sp.]|nr:glycoside hydrolase family 3 N-terminal domain-containing protein [Puia sp.]